MGITPCTSGSRIPIASLAAAVSDAIGIREPLVHGVMPMPQHAVERAKGGDELRPLVGRDHLFEQRIDCRILYADQVARSFGVRRSRAEAIDELAAGRLVARRTDREQVEIEHVEPLLDQREIRAPVRALDAEPAERLEPGRDDALGIEGTRSEEHTSELQSR